MKSYLTSTGRSFRSKPGAQRIDVRERIYRNIVVAPNGCWIYTGHISKPTGYGLFLLKHNGQAKCIPAHRASYEAFVGPIQDGLQIDHLCRERSCVNWRHLEPVTRSVNQSRKPRTTHCREGHPYAGGNAKVAKNGYRRCRICLAAWRKINDTSNARRKAAR